MFPVLGGWLSGTPGVSSGIKPAAVLGLGAPLEGDGWGRSGGSVTPSHRLGEVPWAEGCPALPHHSIQRLVEG